MKPIGAPFSLNLHVARFTFIALVALAVAATGARAQGAPEHEIKAAYLYRFLSFIDWPEDGAASRSAPFVIGVLGAPDVGDALSQIAAGKMARGRPIEVRRLAATDAPGGIQLLFVGQAASARIGALARGAPPGQLVVTESGGALDQGSAVDFRIEDGRVRFAVSLPAAQRAGLRISSRMLSVATEVRGERP